MWHPNSRTRITLAVASFSALLASVSSSAPVEVGGGFDYYSGPEHQITRSALVFAGVGLGPLGSASLAGIRYNDSNVGRGNAYLAGVGVSAAPLTSLHVWGTRYIGDQSFRAWRVKAGPQLNLPAGPSVGLYYLHYEDNANGRSDGGTGELRVPLVAGLSAQASATRAALPGDQRSTQGSVGLSWKPLRVLELTSEVGLARGGAVSGFVPSRGLLDQLLGGPSSQSANRTPGTERVALLGARVTFP